VFCVFACAFPFVGFFFFFFEIEANIITGIMEEQAKK